MHVSGGPSTPRHPSPARPAPLCAWALPGEPGTQKGARGRWPLRRAPRGLLAHSAPATTCLLHITPGPGAPRTPTSGLRPPEHPAGTPRPLSWPRPGPAAGPVARGPELFAASGGTETRITRDGRGLELRAPEGDRTRRAVTECPAPPRPPAAAVLPFVAPQSGSPLSSVSPVLEGMPQFPPRGWGLLWAQGGLSPRPGP